VILSIKKYIALVATLSVVAVLSACGSEEVDAPLSLNSVVVIDVVTTIYPVTYFVERIGGDLVSVTPLLKPGVPSHDFEPGPSDIIELAGADMVVYNHPSFEIWVADALDATANASRVIVQAADIDASESDGIDPHVWLNPLKAVAMVEKIRDGLVAVLPASANVISANADDLIAELTALNDQIVESLAVCGHREIVVSHLAYGHLTGPLGVRQIGLSGISAESETGARRVAEVIDEMRELKLKFILQEPLSNSDLAKTVARETGVEILQLHPLEALTEDEQQVGDDYFTVMQRNIDSLVLALGCSGG